MSGVRSPLRSPITANQGSPVRSGTRLERKSPFPSPRSRVNARLIGSCCALNGPVAVAVATMSRWPSPLTSPIANGYGLGPTANGEFGARVKPPRPSPKASDTSLSVLLTVMRSSLSSRFMSARATPCVCGWVPSLMTIGEVGAVVNPPLPSPRSSKTP